MQTAYRVLVASSAERLAADDGDLWDSGKVGSDATLHVAYAGKPLASRDRCYWKVRVWDRTREAVAVEQAGDLEHGAAGMRPTGTRAGSPSTTRCDPHPPLPATGS